VFLDHEPLPTAPALYDVRRRRASNADAEGNMLVKLVLTAVGVALAIGFLVEWVLR
jgi:hypothetical protein